MVRITHWVPSGEAPISKQVIRSWANMETPDNVRPRFILGEPAETKELESWNKVCTDFLTSGDDWIFSTHTDVVFPPQTLMRLLSWDKPLVSAMIFMRTSPVVPHIWQSYGDGNVLAIRIMETHNYYIQHPEWIKPGCYVMEPKPDDALAETDFTSTSCTLIHRSVLEALEPPYFQQDTWRGGGEDRRFFQNAKAAGFQAYVDRSCVAGHLIGDIPTGTLDFMMWSQMSDYVGTGEPVEQKVESPET